MKTINNNTLETIILSENEMNMVSGGLRFSSLWDSICGAGSNLYSTVVNKVVGFNPILWH